METLDQALEILLSKQALYELSVKYCRAVDRQDTPLMKTLWHDDASVDVGLFIGSATEYADVITQPNPGMTRCFHNIGNTLYQIDGNSAVGEVQVVAAVSVVLEEGTSEQSVGGRYLDRYERRAGEWRFSHRSFVIDWALDHSAETPWNSASYTAFSFQGCRGREDKSYQFLG